MSKRFDLSLVCGMALLQFGLLGAQAQSESAPENQQPAQAAQPAQPAQPAISPDDPRLLLMVRNAIIALNQANQTGNYSVLRDMGTPNFQMTNNSARLAEAFATLRARKLDISPIMFFNPKFASPPAIQDGQVLRITGVFPTTPEQVNFDLAFQLFSDQWMLAGIAVNVAPPGENAQAAAPPASPPPARTAETGDAKPIRIDLSQPAAPAPAPPPAQPAAPKKAAPKKPKPPAQKTAAAQPAGLPPAAATPEQQPAQAPKPASAAPEPWNPFGR